MLGFASFGVELARPNYLPELFGTLSKNTRPAPHRVWMSLKRDYRFPMWMVCQIPPCLTSQ